MFIRLEIMHTLNIISNLLAWRKYQISNIMIMINIPLYKYKSIKVSLTLYTHNVVTTHTVHKYHTTLRCIIKIIATINILSAYK